MTSNRCEILIQRCVDNESSPEERQELMHLLDTEGDGWKNLACTYMEEQLFESACLARLSTSAVGTTSPPAAAVGGRHWFHHPAMSVVLCACVACLLTVIGMEEHHQQQQPKEAVGGVQSVAKTNTSREPASAMAVSSQPQTAWLEADGMDPRELPVYSDVSEFIPSLEAFRQQSNQSVRNFGLSGSGTRIRYLKLKVGSDYLLFPVEETAIEQQIQ